MVAVALPANPARLDHLGGATVVRGAIEMLGPVIVKVDEGADLFGEGVGLVDEKGTRDVAPFVGIDPRNLQSIHWAAGGDIDGGGVIEPRDGDGVPGPASPADVTLPLPVASAIDGDEGRKSDVPVNLMPVMFTGLVAVPSKKSEPSVARIVEGGDPDVHPLIRLRRRDWAIVNPACRQSRYGRRTGFPRHYLRSGYRRSQNRPGAFRSD